MSTTTRSLTLAVLLPLLTLSLFGCDLAGTDNDDTSVVTEGVFVANQGNFGDGNGSVTLYNPNTENGTTVIENLNSIVQSIALRNDQLYVTANTASRLDIFSTSSFELVGQMINQMPSPRYVAFLGNDKAYVSNLFDDISVVNLTTNSVTDTIVTGGSPEGITVVGDQVYAALGGFGASSEVAILDPSADTVSTKVDLGCAARFVLSDEQEEVFALCNNEQTGEAVVLDDAQELTRLSLPDSVRTAGTGRGVGQEAFYSQQEEELHVVVDENRLTRINTATNEISTTLGPLDGAPIGAVGYDAVRKELYVGRVPGFTEQGTVTIHERDGTQTGSFQAGVAPTFIDFRRSEK
jgi:YVTN family beta-propeller protein